MTKILSAVSIGLFLVSCSRGNNSKDLATSKATQSDTSQISVTFETREINQMSEETDAALHATIKDAQVFWLLEEQVLRNYRPDKYEKIIKKSICGSPGEDCTPDYFQIVQINDTVDLIIDYSTFRNGTLGNGNYIVNSKKNEIIEKYNGWIEGIVKAPDFTGFIHKLRYMEQYYENYSSLEQIVNGKIITRKILSYSGERIPANDVEEHFAEIKRQSAGNYQHSK